MKLQYKLLILLFLISLIPRIAFLNKFPPSPNWDEVSLGYNAYSILKTGKDEWGKWFPLIFRAYGDYKLPLYIYFSVPFILILGLNVVSIKLVSVLAGSLLTIVIYLIATCLFKKDSKIPLLIGLIIALSPWSIFLSRVALEANLFLLLFFLSFYFLLIKKIGWSSFFYGLSLFTYNSSRVLLPFYIVLLVISCFKIKFNFLKNWYKFLFLAITIIIFVVQSLSVSGQARYKWVSIIDSGAIGKINELRQKYPRFLINKVTYFLFVSGGNYISHFNPSFIFFNGGSNSQFNIPYKPLISPYLLPFFLVGLIELIINIRKRSELHWWLILIVLIIAPLPSAITRDAPHTLRSIILFPIVSIIIGLGISRFSKISWLPHAVILFIFINALIFWKNYQIYSHDFATSWQYGYKEAVFYAKEHYTQYDQIIFTKKYGEAHEFTLFFWPWKPSLYQNDASKIWDFHADWYWVDGFDKFRFVNDWEIKDKFNQICQSKKCLLITSPDNFNSNLKVKNSIFLPNNDKIFDIVEN